MITLKTNLKKYDSRETARLPISNGVSVSNDFTIHVRRTVEHASPLLPFEAMARRILGPRYELSLTICADKLARRMNKTYRPGHLAGHGAGKKTYSPNVLSFPYGKYEGEIFFNARKASREARQYGLSGRERLALLFVHGCFHLKGLSHGLTMERLERKALRDFGIIH